MIYELTPSWSNRNWAESALYSFTGGSDGDNSLNYSVAIATPFLDQAGNVYVTSPNGGDAFGAAGDGTVFGLKLNPVPTAVTITTNAPSPAVTGQVVTVSFAVSPSAKVSYRPTGTITVNASTGEACSAALPGSGKAHCQLMFLSAGTRTLTATYSGDAKNPSSVCGAATQTVVNLTKTAVARNRR